MYDNVAMTLPQERAKIDLLKVVPAYLSDVSETCFEDGRVSINGRIKNLRIRINQNRLSISEGSLCKYWLGSNVQVLTRGETERAIESLSDTLHLPLGKAKVTRIDVASNFVMRHNEKLYFPYLVQSQYYQRQEHENGIYFRNRTRSKLFYGKLHEQKVKGLVIPSHYQGKHLLRYELRFTSRLPKQFNREEISVSDLYEEVFYMDLLDRWKAEYFNIHKLNSILMNMKPIGSTKEFTNYLAALALKDVGYINLLGKVKEWQGKGEINKKQASDIRKKLKNLSTHSTVSEASEMMGELDGKVNEAAKYYR